jgi:predicted phage terminase large subunit-like protein
MPTEILSAVERLARERLLRLPPAQAEKLLASLEGFGAVPQAASKQGAQPGPAPSPSAGKVVPLRIPEPEMSASGGVLLEPVRRNFLPFLRHMWPGFIEGRHHTAIANAFERIANGTLKRLIINLGPRHGKSEATSVYLPAWYLGHFPAHKVITATHTEKLSVSFGRRVRNLIKEPEYQELFPQTQIAKDSKAAGQWTTTMGGTYYAIGTEGKLAGRGANLLIIDDPHSEQDVLSGGDTHFDKTYEWYMTGPRQRLQPGAAIIINQTRWGKRDLTGKLLALARQDKDADQWEVLSLPAILPDGNALFPEFWPLRELEQLKRNLPPGRWNAQYQQNPTSEESAIVRSNWWQRWDRRAPKCVFTVSAWDTSFGESKKGDPSANTLWGVFHPCKEPGMPRTAPAYGMILLDAYEARLTFPDLKQRVLEMWRQHKPDCLSIEAKTAGAPLIQELQRMGLPVYRDGSAHAGNDKLTRLNAVSDLFRSGLVWYLPSVILAPRVIEQFGTYPDTEHDDLMDTGVQALERFRQGGWIEMDTDWTAEPEDDPDLVFSGPRPPKGGWY